MDRLMQQDTIDAVMWRYESSIQYRVEIYDPTDGTRTLFNIHEGSGVSQSTYVCFQYENPNDDSEYCMIEIRFSDHESGVIKNHDYNWVFGWPLEKNLNKVMQVINDNI